MPEKTADQNIREEFNRWAEAGRGEEMERDHRRITEAMLAHIPVDHDDNVFDAGCGAGWLAHLVAPQLHEGRYVGMDVADEMVRRARKNWHALENAVFVVGGMDEIPWESNFFTKVYSVESAYYWPDPALGLREIFRVMRPGGRAAILINYYRDNPHCHQWGALLAVPTRLLSAQEWEQHFRGAGFAEVGHEFIPDDTPTPEAYSGRWFRDAAQLRAFKQIGALLVDGSKP